MYFTYCNLLLAGLGLATALFLITAFFRKTGLKELASYSSPQQMLWVDQGAPLRRKCGIFLYALALVALLAEVTFFNTQFRLVFPEFSDWANIQLDRIIFWALILKTLFFTRYNFAQLLVTDMVYFALRWVFFNNHNPWLVFAIFFVIAAKDLKMEEICLPYALASALGTGVTILFSLFGVWGYTVLQEHYNITVRRWFGFTFHNTLGGVLFGLCSAWLLYRQAKARWTDWLAVFAVGCFTMFGVASRTAGLCIFFLVIASLCGRYLEFLLKMKPIQVLLSVIPLIFAAANFLLPRLYSYTGDNALLLALPDKLNSLLNDRLYYGWMALQSYTTSIAGQPTYGDYPVDSAYLSSWFFYGPVLFALIWVGACLVIWQLLKRQRYASTMVFLVACVYAWFEIQFFHVSSSPALLLYTAVLYPDQYNLSET